MKKAVFLSTLFLILGMCLNGCGVREDSARIGVSIGAGNATRWQKDTAYMEVRAQELDIPIEIRLNTLDGDKTQKEDCFELIDSGIAVLILRLKNVEDAEEILQYAKQKKVKVINYAGLLDGRKVDLFVGYDCEYIGQQMGKYLTELVPQGDYIILSGAPEDKYVSPYLYQGAMKYIGPLGKDANIILDTSVPNWDPEEAKEIVRDAIVKNGNHVDAILSPNDAIAGACTDVIAELGIMKPVVVTGMDAQIDAVKRIVAGTQSCTIYMDLKTLANTAVEEAYKLAVKQKVSANAEIDNGSGALIPASLITGQLVTKQNIDRVLIESHFYTRQEVYGDDKQTQ